MLFFQLSFFSFFLRIYIFTYSSFKIFNCKFGKSCIGFVHGCSKVGKLILNLEWECAGLEWNILHGERGTADWLLVVVRALVLVSDFAQLLSKCPSHTKLCQERSGTVNPRIPYVILFQTACSARASLAYNYSQTAFARRERLRGTKVWNAIIDLPVPAGSAQGAHRHCTRPFPSCLKQSGYTRLRVTVRAHLSSWTNSDSLPLHVRM